MQQSSSGDAPGFYTFVPLDTRVVDAVTGKPVPGAVVVVLWRLIASRSGVSVSVHRSDEFVTDDEGRFHVPRWGPRLVENEHYLDARDPEIWVLKRGYLLGYFDNDGAVDPRVFRSDAILQQKLSKAAPAQLQAHRRTSFRRPAMAGSMWNGRDLTLMPSQAPEQSFRSLMSAQLRDQYEMGLPRCPRFWEEWLVIYGALPESLQDMKSAPRDLKKFLRETTAAAH